MAAYAALVSLSQTIDKLLQDQYGFPISPHENQQIICIHEHIISLQAFLENFPARGNGLEGRIRDIANEAEDIIEYFMWEQIDQRRNSTSKSTLEPRGSEVSHFIGMRFDFKNLKEVTEEIKSIAREVMDVKNSSRSTDDDSSVAIGSSLSSSSRLIIAPPTSKDDPSVGFEDDLMEIKGRLCGESYQLQVIPIFGMGGIGKTTLAKNAYYDQLIVEHFQIRAWATVSQAYTASQILSSLLVSIGGVEHSKESDESKTGDVEHSKESDESKMGDAEHSKESDDSTMAEQVYKSLKGRRYLIVMDDMWDTEAWDDVRRIFPDDHNSSRILLTTRLLDVAAYPRSSSPIHKMRFMDADQSWNLLRKKAFGQGNYPCELEDIGKIIARSCRGLPLAIVVIAGLLSTMSQTLASWECIASNVNEIVTANNEQFAETVLSLSYNHLPHHLRPCFLYIGGFPEDYEIRVSELIKLWVAEGFLKLPKGCKSFEEVAEEYLEDLVKRSLVLVMKRKSSGKIKSCNVHDLVRDLCVRKAQREKFLLYVDSKEVLKSLKNQRRISFPKFYPYFLDEICSPTSTIRSMICLQGLMDHIEWLLISSKNLRLLRVFQITSRNHVSVPPLISVSGNKKVFELFQLRYLSMKVPIYVVAIPKLENLQTLIIGSREIRMQYPAFSRLKIWGMPQLRHFLSFSYYCLSDPAEGETTFALENLQTLLVSSFVCSKRTVEMMPNLKKLVITYIVEDGYDQDYDYHLENLVHLRHLEKLTLHVDSCFPFRGNLKPVFPGTLKKLTLTGSAGLPWEDIGIVIGSLPDLEVLKLKNFPAEYGDKWETREGKFLSLKFLLIDGSYLRRWITESSHFPRLESLVLHHCWRLNEIPESIGEISTLELIEIYDWSWNHYKNKSLLDSAKRIQEEQQSWGNDALQVRLR